MKFYFLFSKGLSESLLCLLLPCNTIYLGMLPVYTEHIWKNLQQTRSWQYHCTIIKAVIIIKWKLILSRITKSYSQKIQDWYSSCITLHCTPPLSLVQVFQSLHVLGSKAAWHAAESLTTNKTECLKLTELAKFFVNHSWLSFKVGTDDTQTNRINRSASTPRLRLRPNTLPL